MLFGLVADDGRKGANDRGKRVRTDGGADDVVGGREVHDLGAHGFVDGVAESHGACFDGDDFGAEELDAENIEGLAADVFGAYVDGAFHAEFGAHSGSGCAMLAGSCFGYDFGFAQSSGD